MIIPSQHQIKICNRMTSRKLLSNADIKRRLVALSEAQSDQETDNVLSEGRIFFIGKFEVDLQLFELSNSVMVNLKEHVHQPFGIHSWYFTKTFFGQAD